MSPSAAMLDVVSEGKLLLMLVLVGMTTAGCQTEGGQGAGGGGSSGAGSGGASPASCVNVTGAGDEPWFDLTVVGTQFHAYEGGRVRIVVGTQTPNRVGVAELPIVDGAFTLSMPQVLNRGWYVGVAVYLDRNDDDACQPDEHLWDWATRIVPGNLGYDVTPDQLCYEPPGGGCVSRPSAQATCWVGSGDTDLTKPLPCSP